MAHSPARCPRAMSPTAPLEPARLGQGSAGHDRAALRPVPTRHDPQPRAATYRPRRRRSPRGARRRGLRTPVSAGTNGSSCSSEPPSGNVTATATAPGRPTKARSWPRPGTANVHGCTRRLGDSAVEQAVGAGSPGGRPCPCLDVPHRRRRAGPGARTCPSEEVAGARLRRGARALPTGERSS